MERAILRSFVLLFMAALIALETQDRHSTVELLDSSAQAEAAVEHTHSDSPMKNPEVAMAKTEFEKSIQEETRARKELEEAERDVPGWMTQFPVGILTQAVAHVEKAIPRSQLQAVHEDKQPPNEAMPAHDQQHTTNNFLQPHTSAEPKQLGKGKIGGASESKESSSDVLLKHLENDFAAALSEAATLRRKAALQRAQAKSAEGERCGLASCVHEPEKRKLASQVKLQFEARRTLGARSASAKSGLTRDDKKLLGQLFEHNTVLHTVSTEKNEVANQVKRQVQESTHKLVATAKAVLLKDAVADAAKQAHLRKLDLKEQESRAAMTQAAAQLLRIMHGSNDPWLVKTLQHIAKDAAQVCGV
jgi:hypothetical protein